MKLPHADRAYVPTEKLSEYLLSETHPVGRFKAAYFRELGFHDGNLDTLEAGLLAIAQSEDVLDSETTEHGAKFVMVGVLGGPTGRSARIKVVWIIDTGDDRPRIVTAYPR